MASVRELRAERDAGRPVATALALGFALMGASVTGDALRRFHLPRLTGYLLFGVIVGPYLGNLITESMAAQLQVVTGIATTLIALHRRPDVERGASRGAARGDRAHDGGDAGRRHGRLVGGGVAGVAVAADCARCRRTPAAGHAGPAGRDGRLLLADDDGRGGRRLGRARPAERHGAGDRRAGRPGHAGAVLRVDAAGARRVRHRRRARASTCWRGSPGRSAARSPSAS